MLQLDFDNTYHRLPAHFYARVGPQKFVAPRLMAFNADLFAELSGRLTSPPSDEELARIFSGQTLMDGSDPIALVYAGHQFGYFTPRLGDGRALLLGEVVNGQGQRFDIQLKGSGRTPYSRQGDGKSSIGPVIREYIVSESMYHLGVPTTRSLAAVATGEQVYRQNVEPGAVLTRVASSHLRIGTLQYFLGQRDLGSLRALTDYAIARHYPHLQSLERPYLAFFEEVSSRLNSLVVRWLSLGFIHGVMNTDNTSLAGETIDYGPCAFMEGFQSNKVFSSIDENGRYAYDQQPYILQWNLARLADCLIPFVDTDEDKAVALLNQALRNSHHDMQQKLVHMMGQKLGFNVISEANQTLTQRWYQLMEQHQLDFTLSFWHLTLELADRSEGYLGDNAEIQEFIREWRSMHGTNPDEAVALMKTVNPIFIPRNHWVQKAIDEAMAGQELTTFHRMREALKTPFEAKPCFADLYQPAKAGEEVTVTFCGT